jgi:Tfp pilus assembly protein PilX
MNIRPPLKYPTRPNPAARQHGAVLVMALAILLVMTLLGVTVLRTSMLEEKMAGNMQTANRAINVAESCLENALETGAPDRNTLAHPGETVNSAAIPLGAYSGSVTSKYVQRASPPRSAGSNAFSATAKARFYQITCTGNAGAAGVSATAAKGIYLPDSAN